MRLVSKLLKFLSGFPDVLLLQLARTYTVVSRDPEQCNQATELNRVRCGNGQANLLLASANTFSIIGLLEIVLRTAQCRYTTL